MLPTVQHFGPPTVGTNPNLHVAHLTLSNLCQTRANDHDLHKSITTAVKTGTNHFNKERNSFKKQLLQ